MSTESYVRLIMISGLGVNAIACWRRSRSEAALTRRGRAFVERNLASIEDRFVPMVEARFRRSEQIGALIALVGALTFAVVPLDDTDAGLATLPPALVVVGVGAALFALQSAAEAARPLPLAGTSVRTARLRRVDVEDLVRPRLRRLMWMEVAMVMPLAVGLALALGKGWLSTSAFDVLGVVVAGVAVLVAATASEYVARRVATLPETAGDAAQLYWQDALRAESVTQGYAMSTTSIALLWMAAATLMFQTSALAPIWLPGAALASVGAVAGVLFVGFFLDLMALGAPPWFRQRLWPDLVPGEVLAPGRLVVP